MTFETVHTMTDWYDGPRRGVAIVNNHPHVYVSCWTNTGIIVSIVMRERAAIFESIRDHFIRFLLMATIPLVFRS